MIQILKYFELDDQWYVDVNVAFSPDFGLE